MKIPNISQFEEASIPLKLLMLEGMHEVIKDMATNDYKSSSLRLKFKTLSKEEKAQVIDDMHTQTLKLIKILKRHVNKICAELDAKIKILKPNHHEQKSQGDFWTDWPGRN